MSNTNEIRVALVDDHEIVRDGIRAIFLGVKGMEYVGSFAQALDLYKALEDGLQIDVLLTDISLPQISGIELTRNLAKENRNIRCLILSANTSRNHMESALKAGAKGFLPKDCSKEELVVGIEKVYAGDLYIGKNLSQVVLENYIHQLHGGTSSELTDREVEILRHFANGFSYQEISDELSISKKTVEAHKKSIFEKLNIKTNADLVKYAIKHHIVEL